MRGIEAAAAGVARRARCRARRWRDATIQPTTVLDGAHEGPVLISCVPRGAGWYSQVKSPPGPRISRGVAMGASPLSCGPRSDEPGPARRDGCAARARGALAGAVPAEVMAMVVWHAPTPADRLDQRAVCAGRGARRVGQGRPPGPTGTSRRAQRPRGALARTALDGVAGSGRPWPLRFESVRDLCVPPRPRWPRRPASPRRSTRGLRRSR